MPGDPNKLLALGEELVHLAHAMAGQGSVSLKEEEFRSVAVILGLFAKSVKTYQATHILCKAGFGEDAHVSLPVSWTLMIPIMPPSNHTPQLSLELEFDTQGAR